MKPSEALLKHGSDKVTTHSYGPLYDLLFSKYVSPRVLEIGVQKGPSLHAWASAGALAWGVDIDPAPALAEGVKFGRLDATDPVAVANAIALWGVSPGFFNLIIDDGSHKFRDQIAAFHLWYDYLAPGGVYVIEDVPPETPVAPFVRLGGVVHDLEPATGRYDDKLILFRKPM